MALHCTSYLNIKCVILSCRPTELKLSLTEKTGKGKTDYMGYLIVVCTLIPKTQDDKEQVGVTNLSSRGHQESPDRYLPGDGTGHLATPKPSPNLSLWAQF